MTAWDWFWAIVTIVFIAVICGGVLAGLCECANDLNEQGCAVAIGSVCSILMALGVLMAFALVRVAWEGLSVERVEASQETVVETQEEPPGRFPFE